MKFWDLVKEVRRSGRRAWQSLQEELKGADSRHIKPSGKQAVSRPQLHAPMEVEAAALDAFDVAFDPASDRESHSQVVENVETRSGAASKKDVVDLVIGLDFGTSTTKVVIRSPFMARGRAVAIPFNAARASGNPYLLPTRLIEASGGSLSFDGADLVTAYESLKVDLLDHPHDLNHAARAAAYLGLVLREARDWFLEEQAGVYGRFDPRWSLNLGVPSAGYDDRTIKERFLWVARAAWELSFESNAITLEMAEDLITRPGLSGRVPEVEAAVIPEVAAEVVGYARSMARNDGLHVLMDVGASTLDICGFVLHQASGDDRYCLLTALVERLGAHALHSHRMKTIQAAEPKPELSFALSPSDPFQKVPNNGADYVLSADPNLCRALENTDAEFSQKCVAALMRTLIDLRRRRDPNSDRWNTGLTLFLCGGGSRMDFYFDVARCADLRLKNATGVKGLVISSLPIPDDLASDDVAAGGTDGVFLRLAVAYGLSFDSLNIGEIVPPSDIGDVEPPRIAKRPEMPGPDQC